jgi:hypothetical protein
MRGGTIVQTTARITAKNTFDPVGWQADDTRPHQLIDPRRAPAAQLRDMLGDVAATAWLKTRRRKNVGIDELRTALGRRARPALLGRLAVAPEQFGIGNVRVEQGFVHSDRPWQLAVDLVDPTDTDAHLVSVTVTSAIETFVVEAVSDPGARTVIVSGGDRQTLPIGPATFAVSAFRPDGSRATFQRSVFVLPSNPLSLSLGPNGARVTGTWSARGDFIEGQDRFQTDLAVTIANGAAGAVTMNRDVEWKFWDGGVGGTLVEQGHFSWGGNNVAPGFGTLNGTVGFSSPNGSGVYGRYHDKEDMTVELIMHASDGRRISGTITCRVMEAFGVNIIKVGSFTSDEHADLYAAVDGMRAIYEARDITLRGVGRYIISDAQAGSTTVLNSESEYRDLLRDWSVPGDFIDVFVVQAFAWNTYNGYAGDIPGPLFKTGDRDGVAVDKSGFTDASGKKRLDRAVLGPLIGHEVGHYLGLSHVTDVGWLMNGDTGQRGNTISYDEYQTVSSFGWVDYQ